MNTTPNALKLQYSVSPRVYYDFMRGNKDDLRSYFKIKFCKYLNGYAQRPFQNAPYFHIGEALVSLQNRKYEVSKQDLVKVCVLPLDFFDSLADIADVRFSSHSRYGIKAIAVVLLYLDYLAKQLCATIPLEVFKAPIEGITSLNLDVITFDEFKNTRFFKRRPLTHAFKTFYKAVHRNLSDDFYMEISAAQGENVLYLWDCRNGEGFCYEFLRYTEQDFDFLNDKDAQVQKAFISSYATYLIMLNLKQILKGIENA